MRSLNGHVSRLTAVAILSMALLTVASSRAAPPPAAPPPAALPPAAPTPIAQGDVGGRRPPAVRPAATIDGRLPRSPTRTLPAKPFANYVRPSPVSPYMNLFRSDNAGGTIDNYSTLVKPLLQQQRMNRTAMYNRSRLDALEPSLRRNERNLDRIHRRTQMLEGRLPTTRTSSRFMNYGGRFGQR